MTRDEILTRAGSIINGERQGIYGNAEESFAMIADFWMNYLGTPITASDVANMMILMKVARNSSGVYQDDNWIDICGYAALGGEIQGNGLTPGDIELKSKTGLLGKYPWGSTEK